MCVQSGIAALWSHLACEALVSLIKISGLLDSNLIASAGVSVYTFSIPLLSLQVLNSDFESEDLVHT
jgi:hypothetical protein